MRSPEDPPTDGEARLIAQLAAASNLAVFGAVKLGRDLCASIFLNHLALLGSDRQAKRRFVECLLLLGMTHLLARLLRALDGVDLEATTLLAEGAERLILSFSNGTSLNIPLSDLQSRRNAKGRFAVAWSERILEAVARPAEEALPAMQRTQTRAPTSKASETSTHEPVVVG